MDHYNYIIVGGGMTADAAVRGIREIDAEGSIALFSLEPDPPYNRPILSKGLWKGKPLAKGMRNTDQFRVTMFLETRIQAVDPQKKQVVDTQGHNYGYDRLLLATGGAPRRLPFGGEDIIYFRSLSDYRRLRALADLGQEFGVIGGGFIGSEIAAALKMNGKDVVMLFPEDGIGARAFPHDLSQFLNRYYEEKGVKVLPGEMVDGLECLEGGLELKTGSGGHFRIDGAVAGLGILPGVELAQNAGIAVENGILVDEYLHTSKEDIYAAGDAASFYNPALAKRMRVEHEDNANTMGMMAGHNMAASLREGEMQVYHHIPYFYSDLFDLGYEAVGELDSRLETVENWKEPYRKGVVYYLKDDQVRGVLLWDVWSKIPQARQLIGKPRPADLAGAIPVE